MKIEIKPLTFSGEDKIIGVKYNLKDRDWTETSYIRFYRYPTYNCQLSSIGNIQSFLSYATSNDIIKLFKFINKELSRKILLLDIQSQYMDFLSFLTDDLFIMKFPYKSTSGSDMILCMINLTKI